MTKTIYLHVGPHKTGTTVIQKACLDNTDVLDKHGVSFPSLYFTPIGHHDLVNTVRRRAISDEDLATLASGHEKALLSSENFIHFSAQDWKYLSERLAQFEVKIIYAWRRSSLKMYSMWQESVKHGGTTPFHAFFYQDLIRPGESKSLMQTLNLDAMAAAFGKDNIHILDFDALSESKMLVTEFFNLLGVDGTQIDISGQSQGFRNESMDPVTTEVLRCLNSLSVKAGYPQNSKTREVFSALQPTLDAEMEQAKSLMENDVDTFEVGDYFVDRATEHALKSKFMTNLVHYKAQKRTKNIKVANQDWLLKPQAYQLISAMHEKIMKNY